MIRKTLRLILIILAFAGSAQGQGRATETNRPTASDPKKDTTEGPPTTPRGRQDVRHGQDKTGGSTSQRPQERIFDTSIEQYRSSLDALAQRAIGSTSRRLIYDWRRASTQWVVLVSRPAELNNFDSLRAGAGLRFPSDSISFSLDLSYVGVSGSRSSRQLALTPYRQPGRPHRLQLDLGLLYPLAEGVMTASLDFVPPSELVLSAVGKFRYRVYPSGYKGLAWSEVLGALVAPSLSSKESASLEDERLPGMEVDPARYDILAGLNTDVYFRTGFFFSVETLIATPLLATMNDSRMPFGFELNLMLGLSM